VQDPNLVRLRGEQKADLWRRPKVKAQPQKPTGKTLSFRSDGPAELVSADKVEDEDTVV
jgi:hypothetical protein